MLSILITHYNRPKSLKECLQAIQALKLEYPHEIVVSDDCSAFENIELIKKIEGVRLRLYSLLSRRFFVEKNNFGCVARVL